MSTPAPFAITIPEGFLVTGDTKGFREFFRKLGGKWCTVLNGWWFDELLRPSVVELQAKAARGELVPLAEEDIVPIRTRTRAAPCTDWRDDVTQSGTRAGKKWVPAEEEALLAGIKEGQELKALAVEHKRSAGSLTARLGDIALRMESEGKSEYEIICRTGLSAEQIKDFKKGNGRWGSRPGRVTGASVAPVFPSASNASVASEPALNAAPIADPSEAL